MAIPRDTAIGCRTRNTRGQRAVGRDEPGRSGTGAGQESDHGAAAGKSRPRKRTALFLALVPFLWLSACGGGQHSPRDVPPTALVMEGPPLAIAGDYEGMPLEGSMDRTCMSGFGSITVRGEDAGGREFLCTAMVDAPPTEKGRVRGVFQCTGDKALAFSLRNLGPDQGLGIAREPDQKGMMVFFYHASREEAIRRLPAVKEDIAKARQRAALN